MRDMAQKCTVGRSKSGQVPNANAWLSPRPALALVPRTQWCHPKLQTAVSCVICSVTLCLPRYTAQGLCFWVHLGLGEGLSFFQSLRVSTLVMYRAIQGTQKRKQTKLHIQWMPCQSRSPRGDSYNHILSFGTSTGHERTARVPCMNQRISHETVLEEAGSINHQGSPVWGVRVP